VRSEVQVLLDPPFASDTLVRVSKRRVCGLRPKASASRDTNSGALAQLGERLICIQEVIGSIPIGSTSVLHHMIIKPAIVRV
jgi:hypothetical protein